MQTTVDLDDPALTENRAKIIKDKAFLRRIYEEWYGQIDDLLPAGTGPVLEIGSGGGFLSEHIPDLIASDVLLLRNVDIVFDACRGLPVAPNSLRAIVMANVFHHLPDVDLFLQHAADALRPGGRLVMIEPWNTAWSRLVYTNFHHEPFDPSVRDWAFQSTGPLSGANGALPWIVFSRDREIFAKRHPNLQVQAIRQLMPASYLVSGGFAMPSLAPGWLYRVVRQAERLTGFERWAGMFATITLEKV